MKTDLYLGTITQFYDVKYRSESHEMKQKYGVFVTASFKSYADLTKWVDDVKYVYQVLDELHGGRDTDEGVGEPLVHMLDMRWVPICNAFIHDFGKLKVPPDIRRLHNEIMGHLGFPLLRWPPVLVVEKRSDGTTYPRMPSEFDSVGCERQPIND